MTSGFAASIRARATMPVDSAGLAAFRALFGLVMFVGAVRFWLNGWIEQNYVEPTFHFTYYGFGWVRVLPPAMMHALFGVVAISAFCVAIGAFYRIAAWMLFLSFTYIEFIDVTYYLNHYYLGSLLALLCALLPLGNWHSIDARRVPAVPPAPAAWMYWAVRAQIGIVYFYAGIAKVNPDWLLQGRPLELWLASRTDLVWLSALVRTFGLVPLAIAMSWLGCLHDLTMPFLLLNRRIRPFAYAGLVAFHVMTGVLFPIGMFPVIMIAATPIFFDPKWARSLFAKLSVRQPEHEGTQAPGTFSPVFAGAVILLLALQVLVPIRAFAYGGNVLWHEQGMRWSWRVMLREKNGSVVFRVRETRNSVARDYFLSPRKYLNRVQEREMSSQPDLILQLARHIASDLRLHGADHVSVYVDAWASLNGRATRRLVDPTTDLAHTADGFGKAGWITCER